MPRDPGKPQVVAGYSIRKRIGAEDNWSNQRGRLVAEQFDVTMADPPDRPRDTGHRNDLIADGQVLDRNLAGCRQDAGSFAVAGLPFSVMSVPVPVSGAR